jgi:hypothetical protein
MFFCRIRGGPISFIMKKKLPALASAAIILCSIALAGPTKINYHIHVDQFVTAAMQ